MPGGQPRKRVYVSSTFIDLKEHRVALKIALEQAGLDVSSMEQYPAFDARPLDYCLNDVASCDAYVLLLAHRYGYRPEAQGRRTLSITEREYRHAREQGKPCFVFCVNEDHPWPLKLVDNPESQDGRDLATFRQRVTETHGLRIFTDPDNLARQVLAALSAHAWPEMAQPSATVSATGYQWPAAWDFGPYMAQRREGFEGREWLFRDIAVWLADGRSRALMVQADFGVGKSAFMAELVQRNSGGCIAAFHFCQHDTQDTLHPGYFVRSVAAQLAAALPAYKALVESNAALQERLNRALEDPGSAFEGGVLAPLAKLAAPGGPRLLLVDALDESLELDAETARRSCGIVDLLGARAGRFPPWLKVLATTRSNPDVLRRLDGFAPRLIDAESATNLDDLRRYVLHRATREPLARRLREADTTAQALAELLVGKSHGKFLLVVRTVQGLEAEDKAVDSWHMRLDELAALPPGMDAWYFDAFERRYARAGRDYDSTRTVLGVLAAAREPLSIETVAAVLGVEPAAVKAVRQLLPDFLQLRAGRLAFDHFSMAEWLTREDEQGIPRAGCYAVDLPAPQAKLRGWALAQIAAGTAHQSQYLLRHLASHLVNDAERRSVYGPLMLTRFEWLQARLDQDGVDALLADVQYIKGLPEQPWVEAVLYNGARVLRAHPKQLAAQVLGRVGSGLGVEHHLGPLAESVHRYLADPANRLSNLLLPTSRSLRLSTAHVATFDGGFVLALLPDGRLASGAEDGTVRVWDPQRCAEPLRFEGHAHAVTALAVLADGRLASGSLDGTARVWDPQRLAEPQVFEGHAGAVWALAVLPDGRLASGGYEGTVRVWDPQRCAEPQVVGGHAGAVWALAVLPDGHLASGAEDGTVRVWDPHRRAEPLLLDGHTDAVRALAVLSDGRLASGSSDGTVRVWNPNCRAESVLLKGHADGVRALAVLPDGRLASGSLDGTVRVWDPPRCAEPLRFEGHAHAVTALAVLPDGRLASGSSDGTVRVWDPQRLSEPMLLEGHAGEVGALTVLPDGCLASSNSDQTVRVWDPQCRDEPLRFEGHTRGVWALAVLPNGCFASGSSDGTVRVWDPPRRAAPVLLQGHARGVSALAALPDGRLASGDYDGTVWVWDPQHRAEPLRFEGHADGVRALAVLPDGRLASCSLDGTVRVWDLQRLCEPLLFEGHAQGVWALAVLSDGRIASGSLDSTVRVWDPQRLSEPVLFDGHARGVWALAVLPDGRLASSSIDGTVRVWDPQHLCEPLLLKGHTDAVRALAVLPDGRLASGSVDGTVRVWDPRSRAEPVLFKGHADVVRALAVLPDGRLTLGAENGTVQLWNLAGETSAAVFFADAAVSCLAVTPNGLIAAGCADGAVHFLRQAGV